MVGISDPLYDLVILTTNLSYGERTCLGVGVEVTGAADLVARHLTFSLCLLTCANVCLETSNERLASVVHNPNDILAFSL